MDNLFQPLSAARAAKFQLAFQQSGIKQARMTQAHLDLLKRSNCSALFNDEIAIVALKVQPPKQGLAGLASSLFLSKEEASLFYVGGKQLNGKWNWLISDGQAFVTNYRLFFFYRYEAKRKDPSSFDDVVDLPLSLLADARIDRDIVVISRFDSDEDVYFALDLPQASAGTKFVSMGLGVESANDRWEADRSLREVAHLDGRRGAVLSTFLNFFTAVGDGNRARAAREANPQLPSEAVELLEKLSQLKAAGVLSEEEFQAKKRELLSRI